MASQHDSDTDEIPSLGELRIAAGPRANLPLGELRNSEDVDEFMEAIKDTLLFRVEWQTLLSPGPKSLMYMGECFIAASSNPTLSLFQAGDSVPSLPHTSLISNLLLVSDSGVEAFNTAKRRMNELFEVSGNINRHLDNIVKCVRALPDDSSFRRLGRKLRDFGEDATEATACATKAHTALTDWKSLITALRRAILDKQNTAQAPPAVPPPLPIPIIPALSAAQTGLKIYVGAARVNDPSWAELPDIDAFMRRLFGLINYTVDDVSFPSNVKTTNGAAYILRLRAQLQGHRSRLETGRPTDLAYTSKLLNLVTSMLSQFDKNLIPGISYGSASSWQGSLLLYWTLTSGLIHEAKLCGRIAGDGNTWDLTDMVDREYYKRAGIPLSPPANPDLDSLVQCTDALGKVKREINHVIRFFDAVSVLGQTLVAVHVRDFTRAGEEIVTAGQVDEQERGDFVKHARSVKAYFSVIRAVASMYNHIHPTYVAEGLDLLVELSLSSTDEVRALRQRSLTKYSETITVELAEYIDRKKRTILRQIRGEVDDIVN